MKKVKQIITAVQAKPNTQPGGVHGAWFKLAYHSDETPGPVSKPPISNAPKLRIRKVKKDFTLLILWFSSKC
jgi:hypothetical protein|tara:strand:- start:254 stop:469 length:216 start_codon:yes stop_codon:yes gene_type:complete